ncbi:M23 family metallopeptidase [Methylopila turkensis]|uniref:Membrane protein n=1 Tax=Methylopila turkensis TaxID=1437816 RepID=A0A9W6JR77_9HYPH|nr:M23 family metallopeptidase [Methylopila turkensis]GLK81096.1 membrane protein [Methylopila turkensis]
MALGACLALVVLWALGAGFYIAFHDTVVAELRRGAKAAEQGYDAQVADLRNELERLRTRRLVEQTGVEQRFTEFLKRQEALERRQTALATLGGAALADAPSSAQPLSYTTKPQPLDRPTSAFDDLTGATEPQRRSGLDRMETLAAAIDRAENRQTALLEQTAARVNERRRKMAQVWDSLGLARRLGGDGLGRGGPFEPLPVGQGVDDRIRRLYADHAEAEALRRQLDAAPLRSPAPSGSSVSSGFGSRIDPFLGQPALHAGVDFASEGGEPIRATAPGRVVESSYNGGYGLMVEIDHGGGLTTRFAHMSFAAVTSGQTVKAGQIIGRVGSTGRSTGPHLHYETRIDGDAVDPMRFLRAGRTLAAID